MKIHWCCGDIYLKGYMNLDNRGTIVEGFKKLDNPNLTTMGRYYKFPFGSERREYLVDKIADITDVWPFKTRVIDEVVIIGAIEHFDHMQVNHIVWETSRVLKLGGKLIVNFPDIPGTVLSYQRDPDMMMRLIYGTHKDEFSIHKWGYTFDTFRELCGALFNCQEKQYVKTDYPMIGVEAIKV